MMREYKQRIFIGAAIFAILILSLIFFILRSSKDKTHYDYIRVERKPLRVTLRESATIVPEHRLNVTPPIPGRIDSVKVSNGEAVKQGQILAWISSTDRAALMDAARAAGGKEVSFWEDVYKPAPLLAPLDGHIISTSVVPGQVVVSAQTVFTMSDHLIVQASVDETDLHKVSLEQKAEITLDSFPDAKLTGKVHAIAYDSVIINNVTTYLVNIFLDETPDFLRSGITANVFLISSDRENILQIPTDLITPNGEVLLIKEKGKPPVLQKIEEGESDGASTEILSGLQEGDWVARRNFIIKKEKGLVSLLPEAKKRK